MEESKRTQKLKELFEDDATYEAVVATVEAARNGYLNKKKSTPKGGFFDVAMEELLDRGAVGALQSLIAIFGGLRAVAIKNPPSNQTQ